MDLTDFPQPAGKNHVRLYHINGNAQHEYNLQCACSECYARTQRLITDYWNSPPPAQTYTRKQLKKYKVVIDQGGW